MADYDENIGTAELMQGQQKQSTQIAMLEQSMSKMKASIDGMMAKFDAFEKSTSKISENMKKVMDIEKQLGEIQEKNNSRQQEQVQLQEKINKLKQQEMAFTEKVSKGEVHRKKLQSEAGRYNTAKKEREELEKILSLRKQETDESKRSMENLISQKDKLSKKEEADSKKKKKQDEKSGNRGGLFEMAGDIGLPGMSQLSTVSKYAGYGQEQGGGDGLGGAVGMMRGGAIGLGVAGLAYTAYKGYQAYNTAKNMAPMARGLAGQMGPGSGQGRQDALTNYGGYGGLENLQALSQLNSGIGGKYGLSQLKGATDVANKFGIDRSQAIGLTSQLYQAGGASPEKSAKDMEKIMTDAVKAGIDRARVTEFAQQTISIQQGLLRATGENNAQNVSQALSQMIRASGRGEQFLRGPGMQGIMSMDNAMKNATKGGMAGATIMRAFGGTEGFGGGIGGLNKLDRTLEGGLFSGKGGVQNTSKILNQFLSEAGGNKDIAQRNMKEAMGIGIKQSDELFKMLPKLQSGQPLTKEEQSKLKEIDESSKDPMIQLLDIMKKQEADMARFAGGEGLGGIIKIEQGMATIQEKSLGALETIAKAIDGDIKSQMKIVGTAATAYLLLSKDGLMSKLGGALSGKGGGMMGGLMNMLGKGSMVAGAGYGGYMIGEAFNDSEMGKSFSDWATSGAGISDEEAFAQAEKKFKKNRIAPGQKKAPAPSSMGGGDVKVVVQKDENTEKMVKHLEALHNIEKQKMAKNQIAKPSKASVVVGR